MHRQPFQVKTILAQYDTRTITFLALKDSPEGNFLVQKLCRFKNIVPFDKNGPIGRVRQAL